MDELFVLFDFLGNLIRQGDNGYISEVRFGAMKSAASQIDGRDVGNVQESAQRTVVVDYIMGTRIAYALQRILEDFPDLRTPMSFAYLRRR